MTFPVRKQQLDICHLINHTAAAIFSLLPPLLARQGLGVPVHKELLLPQRLAHVHGSLGHQTSLELED